MANVADMPEGQTLSHHNASCAAPLGLHWDIDFIVLQITPGCLQYFAEFWMLGGGSQGQRPGMDPFPPGLELVKGQPFSLRVQVLQPTAAKYQDFGRIFIDLCKTRTPTGHPHLQQPMTLAEASRRLAMQERMVAASELEVVLGDPLLGEYKMFL